MPPEDERRARQLEAMRRYVADLAVEGGRPPSTPGAEPPPPGRRAVPPLPWLVVTGALVLVALAAGLMIGWARGPARALAPAPTSAPPVGTTGVAPVAVATAECKTAVDRANRSLAIAERSQAVLREYLEIMNDLRDGRLDGRDAVQRAGPSLNVGAATSAQFDSALADYNRVVDRCRLQAP